MGGSEARSGCSLDGSEVEQGCHLSRDDPQGPPSGSYIPRLLCRLLGQLGRPLL